MKYKRRLKNIAINIGLFFVSLFICGTLLEIVLRSVHFFQREKVKVKYEKAVSNIIDEKKRTNEWLFFEYDSLLGWKPKAGSEGIFTIPDSKTFVKINSKGLRDAEHTYDKNSKFRILILGDSFTWGFGVAKNERYTDNLGEKLGDSVEIINAGISGYGTDQELLTFMQEGVKYKPDLVIYAFGMEDIINNNHSVQYTYPKPYFTFEANQLYLHNIPVPKRKLSWSRRFNITMDEISAGIPPDVAPTNKNLLKKIKHFFYAHFLSYQLFVSGYHSIIKAKENIDPLTKALITEMDQQIKKSGARFVVVMIPYNYHILKNEENATWQKFIIFFKNQKIDYIDLRPAFEENWQKGQKLYFEIDPHWNPAGHELAAITIYNYLAANKIIPLLKARENS